MTYKVMYRKKPSIFAEYGELETTSCSADQLADMLKNPLIFVEKAVAM